MESLQAYLLRAPNSGNDQSFISSAIEHVVYQMIIGLIGYGVMHASQATMMTADKAAAAFATGSAVTCIPVSLLFVCTLLPLALYLFSKYDENDEEESSHVLSRRGFSSGP